MHVTAIDLPTPAIAHLDLAVARGSAVTDHEMVGQTVAHSADITVVIVEHAGVALPGAAVVNDDELPALAQHRRPIDLSSNRACQKLVALSEKMKWEQGKTTRLLVARL